MIPYRKNRPTINAPNIELIKGDATNFDDLVMSLSGCDGVINCIGFGKGPGTETRFFSNINHSLLRAMKLQKVRRLVTMSNICVFQTGNRFIYGFMVPVFMKWLKHIIDDKERMELHINEETEIDWICVRFPNIVEGVSKPVRSNANGKKLGLSITTASVGDVLVDLYKDDSRKLEFVSYSN